MIRSEPSHDKRSENYSKTRETNRDQKRAEDQIRSPKRSGMSPEEAGRRGGEAQHSERGLQAADERTRERVASAGGSAPHETRGLQGSDQRTRARVARSGGVARAKSRGGSIDVRK